MHISPVGWVADTEEHLKLLSKTITKITHNHPEGLKGAEAVSMAIYCSLIFDSLEDTLRNCVAIGGDCDTTGAMAGAIAEAYYQKEKLSDFEDKFLYLMIDSDVEQLIKQFHKITGSKRF